MFRLARRVQIATAIPVSCAIYVTLCETADAHVKWFCAYNVAGQPDGLENVLCLDFEFLTGLSVLALMTGSLLEGTPIGTAILHALDRATALIRNNLETIFRCSVAFFFIAIWGLGGVLLTPELKTDSTLIGVIQLGIAAGMVSRRTTALSALGIFTLYAIAVRNYCVRGLIDVFPWAAGITLMGACIKKWSYTEWSYPLFIAKPEMSMGFTPDFFMRAAGAVEFALAFALIWTPLVRRVGAAMLAAMFISAVMEFGKIDLIGHTLIVVALFGILADDGGKEARVRDSWLLPFSYAGALALFLRVFYVGHAELFGTAIL